MEHVIALLYFLFCYLVTRLLIWSLRKLEGQRPSVDQSYDWRSCGMSIKDGIVHHSRR